MSEFLTPAGALTFREPSWRAEFGRSAKLARVVLHTLYPTKSSFEAGPISVPPSLQGPASPKKVGFQKKLLFAYAHPGARSSVQVAPLRYGAPAGGRLALRSLVANRTSDFLPYLD